VIFSGKHREDTMIYRTTARAARHSPIRTVSQHPPITFNYLERILQVMTESFRKNEKVWWNLKLTKRRPAFAPKTREDQAGEIIDIEGDNAVIGILNEDRKIETYIVPIEQLRHREIT
jgi:hypothetical protein